MKIIDLSRMIEPGMQVFPGDMSPSAETIEEAGFRTTNISLCSHTGTHIDAPAHLCEGSVTLDKLPPESFFGLAVAADVRRCAGREIEISDIAPYEEKISQADFLLLRTGWEEKFGSPEYLEGFPTLSEEAARFVLSLGLRCVGTDAISADRVESAACPVHHTLLSSGALIIENLRNLAALPEGEAFMLAALPMPLSRADGAPVRVMAMLENIGD